MHRLSGLKCLEADFVFTGTFHGAVFSILNQRPFKVYLTNESRIKKVGALLRELHIPNRKIDKISNLI